WFSANQAIGGAGGGIAFGGGIENNGILSVSQSTFDHNLARGGDGGTISESNRFIGLGFGGGLDNFFATATIDQCIFTGNQAVGGSGGSGGHRGHRGRPDEEDAARRGGGLGYYARTAR